VKVSKWSHFQHYKQRRPPWIKLHHSLLDDGAFQRLPIASKALAPMLWLLASESETPGELPEAADIAWRLRMSTSDFLTALKPLVSSGFVIDASAALAACKHDAILETEIETETETERVSGAQAIEVDEIRADHAAEESRLTANLLAIRDAGEDVQAALDSIAEKGRKPYSAYGWLRNGRSGVPETRAGVTVLRLLNAALEARQRAQAAPIISDSMKQTMEALQRSGDRIRARLAAEGRKEITA